VGGRERGQLAVRVVLAGVFLFMGVAHFRAGPRKVMGRMIPPALRGRDPRTPDRLVLLTGVCELAGGAGLLLPPLTRLSAGALIAFLAAVFPANAHAARHPETFGRLAIPFWPRLSAQVLLAALLAATLPRPSR
jgi:uncharacterized membrane protein